MRARWIAALAVVAAAAAWLGASELETSARLLTVLLVAVLPALLIGQSALAEEEVATLPVIPAYLSSMLLIWLIGGAALLAAARAGISAADLGLVSMELVPGLVWTGGLTLAALAVLAVGRLLGAREAPVLERLLPRKAGERAVFVVLSLSAGIGEELAFRGFLLPALRVASGSIAVAVVVSSLAFGMLHSYQRIGGVLRAGILGALLSAPLLATGSLFPSMAAHALIDLIAGLLLADWLVPPRVDQDNGEHRRY